MIRLPLIPHPATPPASVTAIDVEVSRPAPRQLVLRYLVSGDTGALLLPRPRPSARGDKLWEHSCFEAFVMIPPGYIELNFAPSTEWAAYRFSGYREGKKDAAIAAPAVETLIGFDRFELIAELTVPVPGAMALSAVIEEKDGTKSYWALAHPAAEPDFHHPDAFLLPESMLA
jgi:hypothetical protein